MKYLVIGSGGREHAFVWAIRRDEPGAQIFVAPGNAGTEEMGINVPIAATDLDGLVEWARRERPDLTIVGPEAPLCAGVVDRFEAEGLRIFGPNRAAARLEGSKVYTKNLLLRHGLPTAPGACFDNSSAALAYSEAHPVFPQVIKADGLAAGKGVIIAQDLDEAHAAIRRIMDERVFGEAGRELVIEEFLPGREMSIHVLTDGRDYRLLPISQDHKKLLDDDRGPNTGGMGAYAPAPFATEELKARITAEVVEPVLAAFVAEGIDLRGILYIGLIWTPEGPRILEFNVRGGDPETQVLLPLVQNSLIQIFFAIIERRLGTVVLQFNNLTCVTVVIAAAGYPDAPRTGFPIKGLDDNMKNTFVFHGGTKRVGNKCLSSGGRVLAVTGWSEELSTSRALAYSRCASIFLAESSFRADIALRVIL